MGLLILEFTYLVGIVFFLQKRIIGNEFSYE